MRQILHILKKDVGCHWPEILFSLIFLGLYTRVTLHAPDYGVVAGSFPWFQLSRESIPPLMVGFWAFLTLRLVHGETLVGDRQWWTTKPYEWWKLLAAKELFLLLFIGVPLFLVQLFLLHHAGFPVRHNLLRVLNMQFRLGLILFLSCVALGSLTKSLGQALLGIVIMLFGTWGAVALLEKVPSGGMSAHIDGLADISGNLILAAILGAAGWQYARRRTWASRGLLLSGVALVILIEALTPYPILVVKKYPLPEGIDAPVKFTARTVLPNRKKKRILPDSASDVYFSIPLAISGVAPGRMVRLDGMRVSFETPGGEKWDPGWKAQYLEIWTENEREDVTAQIKRKDHERVKSQPVSLHIELAITEFEEREARELVLPDNKFTDAQLGICRLSETNPSQIDCRRPFQYPDLMASFDPSTARCQAEENEEQVPEDKVTHVWFGPHEDNSSSLPLNPVLDYPVGFGSRTWVPSSGGGTRPKLKVTHLCPGAKIHLAKPQETRHLRLKLETENVRLQDLSDIASD